MLAYLLWVFITALGVEVAELLIGDS